jgi:hypothetical protein
MYTKHITGFKPPELINGQRKASLRGIGYKVGFFDLLAVDVRYSKDGKSFDADGSSALVFRASETNHVSAGFLPTINQGQKPPETRNQRRPWLFLTLPRPYE